LKEENRSRVNDDDDGGDDDDNDNDVDRTPAEGVLRGSVMIVGVNAWTSGPPLDIIDAIITSNGKLALGQRATIMNALLPKGGLLNTQSTPTCQTKQHDNISSCQGEMSFL